VHQSKLLDLDPANVIRPAKGLIISTSSGRYKANGN
jgi:hypothetical protein